MNNDIISRLEEVNNRIASDWDYASGLWRDDVGNRFGQTFVIVTHDESLAQMTDRSIHMKDGLIYEAEVMADAF